MNLNSFTGAGSTPSRRRFWDKVTQAVNASRKTAGKNVTVAEHQAMGTVVNISRDTGAPTPPPDCSNCDDLQPTNPSGVPVHINIVRTMSGSCGDIALSGSITYDLDLGFAEVGPVGGHFFCAHNIFDNGFGAFWTGHFTATCTLNGATADFGSSGTGGLLGRDRSTCEWWFNLDGFGIGWSSALGTCGFCEFIPSSIFEMIAAPGDPSGIYTFTETGSSGGTLTTVVTIT